MTNKLLQSTERHRLLTYNYLRVSSSGFFLKAVAIDLAGTWNQSKPGSQVFLICFSAHFLPPFFILIIVLSTRYPPHTPPQWNHLSEDPFYYFDSEITQSAVAKLKMSTDDK